MTEAKIIALPISIEYYGQITEKEWEKCVEYNTQALKSQGYVKKFEFNQNTDSHIALFSPPDLKFLAVSSHGRIEAFDENNNDIEIEIDTEILDIWNGLG